MSSLVEKFRELESLLVNSRHTLALHAGVPFVLLIYDPQLERQCREEQAHLGDKLEDAGLVVHEIPVLTFIFDHYAHTCQLPDGHVGEGIRAAKNVIFCFGLALPSPEVLAVRPRSIGVAETDHGFVISFMEAPMPIANAAMEDWANGLREEWTEGRRG